jgi:hypothetical protein
MKKDFAGISTGGTGSFSSPGKRVIVDDNDWGHTRGKHVTFDEHDPKTKENTLVKYFNRLE